MRILHCIPTLRSGGAERQLSILASAQVGRGAEVHVAYIHPGPHARVIGESGVGTHRLRASGNTDPRIIRQLWSLAGRIRPDVLHTWLPQMDVAGGMVALSRRIPWIVGERSSAEAYANHFAYGFLRKSVGRRADAVVANSHAGAQVWERVLRGGARTHVIRNVLPLDAIAAARPARLDQLGLEPGQPAVIFAGRLAPEKNVDLLLGVATDVCRVSGAAFLICGDGPARVGLQRLADDSTQRARIKILGDRDDVWDLMKAARVFVSTSAFEGQPNSVLEAMACGCPLVVSDIAAHREFLDETMAQIVPLAQDRFVDSILRGLADSADIQARTVAARREARRYDVASATLAYEMVYKEAALRHERCVE